MSAWMLGVPHAPRFIGIAVLAVVACSRGGQTPADTATSIARVSSVEMPVSGRGIGPMQVGMTLAQARAVLPGLELPAGSDAKGCEFARSLALPAHVMVMVVDGIAVRVDVDSNTAPTAEGVRVGDTEARVRSVYGRRLSASPNKYTGEPDLRVRAADPADTIHEMVFETVDGKVVHYHAGMRPYVRYVEGCS